MSELRTALPQIKTSVLPGPKAKEIIERRAKAMPDAIKCGYPVVIERGEGAMVEDVDGNINITDLGLNDFKMDIATYINENGVPKNVAKGMHAVVKADESKGIDPGIIFVLKNINNSINFNKQNRLHPYYLIYVDKDKNIINNHLQVKSILEVLRSACKHHDKPIEDIYEKCRPQESEETT